MISLHASASWAQVTSGEITGTVMDATKAVVPGVEVIATNVATGVSRNGLSEVNGLYRIPFLQPGSYNLKASLDGFKTAAYDGITVTVGEIVHVDVILEVGNISETVTISGEATTVDVEQGRVSTLVDGKRILDMPLNGRNVYDLMQLAPGAVNTNATVYEVGTGLYNLSTTSINGGRVSSNGFWLDGVTNKGLSGGTNLTPGVDSIQEFRMESINFSAEFGDSAGSVVNVVSKSGTNSLSRERVRVPAQRRPGCRQLLRRIRPGDGGKGRAGIQTQPVRGVSRRPHPEEFDFLLRFLGEPARAHRPIGCGCL